MASDFGTTMRGVAEKIAHYVDGAATLTVETRFVEVGLDKGAKFEEAKPAARTEIKLDGDNSSVLPMMKNENGALEVDETVYELHMKNVQAAIDYRAKMVGQLLSALQSLRG
jgi:hypothetical protein